MKVRRILFLSLGLERVYPPEDRKDAKDTTEKLIEPDGARVCRRNILALAGVVVLAGAAGADPRDLDVFGVKPADDWGVLVLGAAAILAHAYWYVLRYFHLRDDGEIERELEASSSWRSTESESQLERQGPSSSGEAPIYVSNWAAFLLTCLSWWTIGSWMAGVPPW